MVLQGPTFTIPLEYPCAVYQEQLVDSMETNQPTPNTPTQDNTMTNILVTETSKNHAGVPFAGLVNLDGTTAQFLDEDHANAFIEAESNAAFFAEFASVEVVPAS